MQEQKSVYLPACGVEHLYNMAVTPRGADSGLVRVLLINGPLLGEKPGLSLSRELEPKFRSKSGKVYTLHYQQQVMVWRKRVGRTEGDRWEESGWCLSHFISVQWTRNSSGHLRCCSPNTPYHPASNSFKCKNLTLLSVYFYQSSVGSNFFLLIAF